MMKELMQSYMERRIEQIEKNLRQCNGEYAHAVERKSQVMENIAPIIHNEGDILISGGDCMDFNEYLEKECQAASLMMHELYKQGYLDCVSLLEKLGVLK